MKFEICPVGTIIEVKNYFIKKAFNNFILGVESKEGKFYVLDEYRGIRYQTIRNIRRYWANVTTPKLKKYYYGWDYYYENENN